MSGSNKSNIETTIRDTIKRSEEQTQRDSVGNAWMVPLREDLHALLAEGDKLSGEEMDKKLREILNKHQPN